MSRLLVPGWIVTALCPLAMAVQSDEIAETTVVTPASSAYVRRMMSLDRDADGFLAAEELPGKLAELIASHDDDGDQRLSPGELAAVEQQARAARDTGTPRVQPRASAGRGRRRGPRPGSSGAGASPLDAEQILRFALTFDMDADGGLDADELKRYAAALAIRRAQGRGKKPTTTAERRQTEPRHQGPGSRNSSDGEGRPSGAPAQGLGSDGSGGGGFGDEPPRKKEKK